jgi:hypothetical protein
MILTAFVSKRHFFGTGRYWKTKDKKRERRGSLKIFGGKTYLYEVP